MIGMNAHINLDLGIAAATVAPTPAELEALHADFNRINDVLARLVRIVEDAALHRSARRCSGSPTRHRGGADLRLRLERGARRGVEAGAGSGGRAREAWPAIVARRDALSALAARALYPLHGLAAVTARLTHGTSRATSLNIQVVAE